MSDIIDTLVDTAVDTAVDTVVNTITDNPTASVQLNSKEHVNELLSKDGRTHRYLDADKLLKHYTEEELEELLMTYSWDFTEIDKRFKLEDEVHRWTKVEDDFILANYKYLSDNIIGLALNVRGYDVKLRRLYLGCHKGTLKETYKVVVWAKRSDFEEACSTQLLNKSRKD